MSLALPARRSLAAALTFTVVVGGLSLAPLSATAATPTTAQNATTVLNAINDARAAASTEEAYIGQLTSSVALTKIAQKYAADSAAKGKIVAEPTSIPVDAYSEDLPAFDVTIGQISSKAKASAGYAALDSTIATNAAFDFTGVGYATKGTKTFVVALVADYVNQPQETQVVSVPKINGTVAVGRELYASATFTTEPDWYQYTWFANGEQIATGNWLTIWGDQLGKTITVTITAERDGYADFSATSKKTSKVAKSTPQLVANTPYGNPNVGQSLSANFYNKTYLSGVSYALQWYRNGAKVAGATSYDYPLTASDKGKKISLKVTASGTGFTTVSKTSKSVTIKAPLIGYVTDVSYSYNTESAGLGTVFTVNKGDWFEDAPQPTATGPGITLKVQWLRDGRAIKGATKDNYTATKADLDHSIAVKVSGSLKGYDTTVRWSEGQTFVVGAPFTKAPTYKQSGTFKTGKTLKISVGNLMSGAKVTYAFYNYNYKKVGSKSSYKVTSADYKTGGVFVYVQVKKAGYTNQFGPATFGWSKNGSGGLG
jgi:hypothetical protein